MAIRTYGLSGSGMDIDQMVKDMMKARRASYDKVWQQKTQVEWKKKDFNTLYTLTQDFRNNTLSEFKKQNSLRPLAVASTNDSVVSATANADAAAVTHSVVVKQLAEGVTASSSANLTAAGKTKDSLVKQFDGIAAGSTLDFTINGKQIKINVTDTTTMNDVVSSINNAGAGVKANYDATLDRFFLYSDNTGAAATIDFKGSTADGLKFLQDKLQLGTGFPKTGKDAMINLDGVDITKSSNTFQVSGVFYNLKTASPKDADGNAVVTKIAVKPDIDKTIANVKEFVDNYNTYLGALNTEINEDRYRDFLPLTDAQKKDMKDSDIQAWEQKAKSGMLRRDPLLSGVVTNMRLNFSQPVEGLTGKYRSAADIGIGTGAYVDENGKLTTEFTNAGKIYVNVDTLRKALEEDPDAVAKIFGTSGDKASQSGVAARLYDQLNTSMRQMKEEAGYPDAVDTQSNLAKRLTDYDKRLTDMTGRLNDMEQQYYKQFDAMESALRRMNQQSSWLMQQFSK